MNAVNRAKRQFGDPRIIDKSYNEGLEKEAKMLFYIWIMRWSFRQALRFALNGYDYGEVTRMGIQSAKEIRYKYKNRK